MKTINSYKYNNEVNVLSNIDYQYNNYTVMYAHKIKIYRNIDNKVFFHVKNHDQKSVDLSDYSLKLVILLDNNSLYHEFECEPINATRGKFSVLIPDHISVTLDKQMYNYALYIQDADGYKDILYSDDFYNCRGEILVGDGPYPSFKQSLTLYTVNQGEGNFSTSTVSPNQIGGNSEYSTFQLFFTDFTGTVNIEYTSEPIPQHNVANWTNVKNSEYLNATGSEFFVINGIYEFMRVTGNAISGKIEKILFRA